MSEDVMNVGQVKAIVDVLETPELVTLVTKWHHDKNLIEGASAKDQTLKLMQEVGELSDSICKQENPIDDIGDCLVVLINLMEREGLSMDDCLRHAYKEIMHRKGRMVDGVFVKEEDLPVDGEWIVWGPEHPVYPAMPIGAKDTAEVIYEGRASEGDKGAVFVHHPLDYRWAHQGTPGDIIAYRVVSRG